jgi:Cys-rich repeat protein
MYKKISLIFIIFLLAISVNAQNKAVGDSCLNNIECSSGICQGGECREDDITNLLGAIPGGIPTCTTNADCTGSTSFCNTASDLCVECLEDDYCEDLDDDYPYCNTHKECVECTRDRHCPSGDVCEYYECEEANGLLGQPCIENWQYGGWSVCVFGKQTRTYTDLNDCENEFPYIEPVEEQDCTPTTTATCNDGILNQGESGVDCGGPCDTCKSCHDDIQNCHSGDCEDGIDCGGPCIPCKHAIPIMLVIITAFIVVILLILGIWYWKIRETGELVKETIKEFKPPIQPSSRLKI